MVPRTHTPKALLRPAVWSNLVFLVPLMLALSFGNYVFATVITVVFFASTLYHFMSEKEAGALLDFDRTAAGVLVLFNAGLVGFGGFSTPYVYFVFLLIGIALYLFRKGDISWSRKNISLYEGYHALWHITSALITIFSIFTYYF